MDLHIAINNLYSTYAKYGASRELLGELLADGVENMGFTVRQAYNGVRMVLGNLYNESELFSVSEVAEMLGVSEAEALQEVERSREQLEREGKDVSEYFIEQKPISKFIYFPEGRKRGN